MRLARATATGAKGSRPTWAPALLDRLVRSGSARWERCPWPAVLLLLEDPAVCGRPVSMMAALQAALDASAKVKDRSMHTVDVDEPVIRDSIVVPDPGQVVHDRDCVKILGERCARRWFGPLTVAPPRRCTAPMVAIRSTILTRSRPSTCHVRVIRARAGSAAWECGTEIHTPDERESSHDKPAPRTTPIGADR